MQSQVPSLEARQKGGLPVAGLPDVPPLAPLLLLLLLAAPPSELPEELPPEDAPAPEDDEVPSVDPPPVEELLHATATSMAPESTSTRVNDMRLV